ncbi:hypothetical protein ES754_07330 [Psychrobacter frigidicola]|uniref:Uncharacterized protein n=1 Tax=Psychrobacter frigidicola TaxID=45611 RepID=A0A5C7A2D6_9GAMM|nr:hypothetical protein [Psychrobacter frigidicola]TXD96842.1 hypothetical protein ES754_07330 [Psychrobacter frigidicola]
MKFPTVRQFLFSRKAEQEYTEYDPDNLTQHTADLLKRNASMCRCGGLAPPIEEKGHIYRCVRCNKEFSNISYNLGRRQRKELLNALPKNSSQLIDMDYYDTAIILLKKEDKR